MSAPSKPICRDVSDPREPCQFASLCDETRQRLHHYATPPIRGEQCWKFQQLTAQLGSDAQQERAAIQEFM